MHAALNSLFDLTGRVALVTGSSRGLGRAVARGFARAGASVVICSRKLESCRETVVEIEADGGRALAVDVNMSDPDAPARLVAATLGGFGRLDILVNNAATVLDRPLHRVEAETFNGAFGTNLLAPFLLVEAARPHLAKSGHGAIINILSIAMAAGSPDRYYYPPIKAALAQATRSMALDLGPEGIRVNVTLCFQSGQALLAAKAGAAFISPFVGRLDDVSEDGMQLIRQIVKIYNNYPALKTEVLAASIRHPLHVIQSAEAGAHVGTMPLKVIKALYSHPLTDRGNIAFLKDWEGVPDKNIIGRVEAFLAARA